MSNAVQGNWAAMQDFGLMTLAYVAAIAFGIGAVWAVGQIAQRVAARAR